MTEVTMNVRGVPADVHRRLLAEATEQEKSLIQVAAEILSEYFGISLQGMEWGKGKSPTPAESETQMMLRLPRGLQAASYQASRAAKQTQSSFVIRVIAAHYGIPYEPKRRGRVRIST